MYLKGEVMPKIGMRMLKTAIAVFSCFVIYIIRGKTGLPFYSAIAAVLCMQPYVENSIKVAKNRTVGTFIGAFFGMIVLIFQSKCVPLEDVLMQYFLASIFIIPVIYTTILLKKPTASYIACVVFLSITIAHGADVNPFKFVMYRVTDTLIGIFVSLFINRLHLPKRRNHSYLFVVGADGTIFNEEGQMSPYTKVELNRLISEGANIALATEKTVASFLSCLNGIDLKLPIIAMDGAVLYDRKEKRYLCCNGISWSDVEKMKAVFDQMKLHCFINVLLEDALLIFYSDFNNLEQEKLYQSKRSSPYRNYIYGKPPKKGQVLYFLAVEKKEVIDLLEENIRKLSCSDHFIFFREKSANEEYVHLKIYHKNATKQYMARYLQASLKGTYIVAFGSRYSDISLFEGGDLSFATDSAEEAVKQVADIVIKHKDGENVMKQIAKIFEPYIWKDLSWRKDNFFTKIEKISRRKE